MCMYVFVGICILVSEFINFFYKRLIPLCGMYDFCPTTHSAIVVQKQP